MGVPAERVEGVEQFRAAFGRAMQVCEARLSERPDDAEALAWHGSGALFRSGLADPRGAGSEAA